LLEEPDGSLLGAGSIYEPGARQSGVLARFLPGSGTEYDPSFGGGTGLVRLDLPPKRWRGTSFSALTLDGGKIVAGGDAEGSFLMARFTEGGALDQSFGNGGYVVPSIAGPSADAEPANSEAQDVVALGDGRLLIAGGTSEWGEFFNTKYGFGCNGCPQPLLVMVDASGGLDQAFGSGGVMRLLKPDGSLLVGKAEQVAPLADGKILVKGAIALPESVGYGAPFLARLNPDGSYDPTFGEGGLTVVEFPCTNQSRAERRRAGCVASLRAKVGLRGLRQRRPVLSVRAWPSLEWAAIGDLTLTLPKYLRLTRAFRSKLSVRGAGADAKLRVTLPHDQKPYTSLAFSKLDSARQLRLQFKPGSLHLRGRVRRKGLTFKLRVHFSDARWGNLAGHDEVTQRVG